jgi:hypothetical protein
MAKEWIDENNNTKGLREQKIEVGARRGKLI